jgi:hypothetical protein
MCSTVEKPIGAQAASREPRRQIEEVAAEAVNVEAHDAADVLAQIVAALTTGLAGAAGKRAVHHHAVAVLERYVRPDRGNLTGGFGADHERQLALGEGHAAEAPEVEVIERHRVDAHLYLAGCGRRRRGHVGKLELAIGNQGEGTHRRSHTLRVMPGLVPGIHVLLRGRRGWHRNSGLPKFRTVRRPKSGKPDLG